MMVEIICSHENIFKKIGDKLLHVYSEMKDIHYTQSITIVSMDVAPR